MNKTAKNKIRNKWINIIQFEYVNKIPPPYPIPINLCIARNWRSWGKPQPTATFESRVRMCAAIAPLSVSALLAQNCLLGQWKTSFQTSFQMDMFVWGTCVLRVLSWTTRHTSNAIDGEGRIKIRSNKLRLDVQCFFASPRRLHPCQVYSDVLNATSLASWNAFRDALMARSRWAAVIIMGLLWVA